MLGGEQEAVGQKAGPAQQSALGGDPRQLRKTIVFRETPKNDVRGLAVVIGGKKLGGGVIG